MSGPGRLAHRLGSAQWEQVDNLLLVDPPVVPRSGMDCCAPGSGDADLRFLYVPWPVRGEHVGQFGSALACGIGVERDSVHGERELEVGFDDQFPVGQLIIGEGVDERLDDRPGNRGSSRPVRLRYICGRIRIA